MSKLFKLKEWLTIPDAARHLSGVFGEEVSDADVLRLGLDGHLRLSVNFVNGARAKLGTIVSIDNAETNIFSRDITDPLMRIARDFTSSRGSIGQSELPPEVSKALKDGSLWYAITDINIDDENFLHLKDEVSHIGGVWDLPLIGSEQLDVEHYYQQLTNGPSIEGVNLEGTFIKRGDGTYASLQERFDSPEMKRYTEAYDPIFVRFASRKLGPKEPKPYHHPDNYYPAGGLPTDSVLVVRTSALTELQAKMMEEAGATHPARESTREKNNLLRIIGLMANQRYAGDIGKPYSIASHLIDKAKKLGIKTPADDTIVKHIEAALAFIETDKH